MNNNIIAGPILRRTQEQSVSVWLALEQAALVRLRVYSVSNVAGGWTGLGNTTSGRPKPLLVGTNKTVAIGNNLHVVCATATSATAKLSSGKLYCYDIEVLEPSSAAANEYENNLHSFKLLEERPSTRGLPLGYAIGLLPRVILPAPTLANLRIFHGSCRKPHAPGKDALAFLDNIIDSSKDDPLRRPQQLVLTGDQIYADDVSPPVLKHLISKGIELLGWAEQLPVIDWSKPGDQTAVKVKPHNDPYLRPYLRQPLISAKKLASAKMTSKEARCHLLALAEFCAMYLFVWSEDAGMANIPFATDILPPSYQWLEYAEEEPCDSQKLMRKLLVEYDELARYTREFIRSVPKVRRVLANIPTYMMFDDHEVTDDWNLDGTWASDVLTTQLGRQIISNALAAYAVFQAWGNDPDSFAPGTKGQELLGALESWRGQPGDTVQKIQRLVGVVPWGKAPIARTQRVTFDYAIEWANHRLITLDTRTWRRLVNNERTELIDTLPGGPFISQVRDRLTAGFKGVTIVLSPPPVLGLKLMEEVLQPKIELALGPYTADAEAWTRSNKAFQWLLSALAEAAPTVILSGDVHYAFSVRCEHWDTSSQKSGVIVQLVSSALKNESNRPPAATHALHQWTVAVGAGPESYGEEFAGWRNPNSDLQVKTFLPGALLPTESKRLKTNPAVSKVQTRLGPQPYGHTEANRAPNWLYRVELQREWRELSLAPPFVTADLPPVVVPNLTDKTAMLRYVRDVSIRQNFYLNRGGSGMVVVGVNNLGEVFFEENPFTVIHSLWWHPPINGLPIIDSGMPSVKETAMPFTSHRMLLQQPTAQAPVVTVTP